MSMSTDGLVLAKRAKIMKLHSEPSTAINCSVFRQSETNGDAN